MVSNIRQTFELLQIGNKASLSNRWSKHLAESVWQLIGPKRDFFSNIFKGYNTPRSSHKFTRQTYSYESCHEYHSFFFYITSIRHWINLVLNVCEHKKLLHYMIEFNFFQIYRLVQIYILFVVYNYCPTRHAKQFKTHFKLMQSQT